MNKSIYVLLIPPHMSLTCRQNFNHVSGKVNVWGFALKCLVVCLCTFRSAFTDGLLMQSV